MIVKAIIAGVDRMHNNGIVHRDMNPTNVFISDDGKIVKILDFNVSKLFDLKSNDE